MNPGRRPSPGLRAAGWTLVSALLLAARPARASEASDAAERRIKLEVPPSALVQRIDAARRRAERFLATRWGDRAEVRREDRLEQLPGDVVDALAVLALVRARDVAVRRQAAHWAAALVLPEDARLGGPCVLARLAAMPGTADRGADPPGPLRTWSGLPSAAPWDTDHVPSALDVLVVGCLGGAAEAALRARGLASETLEQQARTRVPPQVRRHTGDPTLDEARRTVIAHLGAAGQATADRAPHAARALPPVVDRAARTLLDHALAPDHAAVVGYADLCLVERLALDAGSAQVGGRAWYPQGAERLLATQNRDGGWPVSRVRIGSRALPRPSRAISTALALRFLAAPVDARGSVTPRDR